MSKLPTVDLKDDRGDVIEAFKDPKNGILVLFDKETNDCVQMDKSQVEQLKKLLST